MAFSKAAFAELVRAFSPEATDEQIHAEMVKRGYIKATVKASTEVNYDDVMTGDGSGYKATLKASWEKLQDLYLENPARFKEIVALNKRRGPKTNKAVEPTLPEME